MRSATAQLLRPRRARHVLRAGGLVSRRLSVPITRHEAHPSSCCVLGREGHCRSNPCVRSAVRTPEHVLACAQKNRAQLPPALSMVLPAASSLALLAAAAALLLSCRRALPVASDGTAPSILAAAPGRRASPALSERTTPSACAMCSPRNGRPAMCTSAPTGASAPLTKTAVAADAHTASAADTTHETPPRWPERRRPRLRLLASPSPTGGAIDLAPPREGASGVLWALPA